MAKPLGIVITPAEVQYEGLDTVLDNIQLRAGAQRVNTTLGVYEPVPAGQGRREPPLDVMGEARVLDRPLWGRQVLYLKSYLPSEPEPGLYTDLPFPPPAVAPRPELRVDVPRQIVDGCRRRGLGVSIQISPYTLPSLPGGQSAEQLAGVAAAAGRPRRVDGSIADSVLAGHGCLNDPKVRALGLARLRDALRRYPDVDAVYLDWSEYTCYFLEDAFTCFCERCRERAGATGYDWDRILQHTQTFWQKLHHLEPGSLRSAAEAAGQPTLLAGWLEQAPGVLDLWRLKAETVASAVGELRAEMDSLGLGRVALGVNGFPPPWSLVTGMHQGMVVQRCQELRVKLFTFHWPMIVRWYAESLLCWNPGLKEAEVLRTVRSVLDLPSRSDEHRQRLADYGMPRPDESHLLTSEGLTRRLNQAVALAGGQGALCSAYLHSYRPAREMSTVLRAALESEAEGIWVQRYGYLSDEKLELIGQFQRAAH